MSWCKNLTNINKGIFRTTNGTANELIGIGRTIKAGFNCSKVDIPNAKYDAVIDTGNGNLLRIQIKGAGGLSYMANFEGGGRTGFQITKDTPQRKFKYTKADCDIVMVVNSDNGDCYIIPVEDLKTMKSAVKLSKLEKYKENWQAFKRGTT